MGKRTREEQRQVTYRRLLSQALPEMWGFQFLVTLGLSIPSYFLIKLVNMTAEAGGSALTSADLASALLSWHTPVILVLGILLVFFSIVMEIFAQIYLTDDILNGREASFRREMKQGFAAIKRFLNPTGLLVVLFIAIAVPLCGFGFSISLTRTLHIPNFIMDVVWGNPLYAIGYVIVILFLVWVAYRSAFILHEVLIDGKTCSEGRRESFRLIKENRRDFLQGLLHSILLIALIQLVAFIICDGLPVAMLENASAQMPQGESIDILSEGGANLSEAQAELLVYRILCALKVFTGGYIYSTVAILCSSYLLLRITRLYLDFTRGPRDTWLERPTKYSYIRKLVSLILVQIAVIAASIFFGVFFDQMRAAEEPVGIVAHRAGGTMASENSLEGLQAAIDQDCLGSEIDVQRTKDGYYIINHDANFKRLTGVAKTPQEMTLEEVRQLLITDTTGSGAQLPVATFQEMLDVTKDKELLFVELKGATADQQMVDDIVSICREQQCVDDVVLISLDYKVIDYAETTYPEFETGTLFFVGIGNVSRLNCDYLIMEEEMATDSRISQVRNAGKKALVWTVNTKQGLYSFLDSEAYAVITDQVLLAKQVQEELDERSDLTIMQDRLGEIWS